MDIYKHTNNTYIWIWVIMNKPCFERNKDPAKRLQHDPVKAWRMVWGGAGGGGGANNQTEIYIAQWEQSQFGRFQILVRVEN